MVPTRILGCVHYNFEIEDMSLFDGHYTPLGHGQQLREILSRSEKG